MGLNTTSEDDKRSHDDTADNMDINNFVYNQISDLSIQNQLAGLKVNENKNSKETSGVKQGVTPLKKNSDVTLKRINDANNR